MSVLQRQRVVWSGFPGGPGISTFYFGDAALSQSSLRNFFANLAPFIPIDVSMTVEAGGDTIEAETGALVGVWAGAAAVGVSGSGTGSYAAPAGASITWTTGGILDGRRLRGRTFLVPMVSSSFEGDGSLVAATILEINDRAAALLATHPLNQKVWHRPRVGTGPWTDVHGTVHPAKVGHAGGFDSVVSAFVADKVAVLRSRRD